MRRLLPLFFLVFYSCTKHHPIDKAEWMLGEWTLQQGEEKMLERWSRSNDTLFEGASFSIIGTDTVWSEKMTLSEINNEVFYNALVADQNEGKAVSFKLVSSSEGKLLFENPEHDFPQRILYRRFGLDSMVAEISLLNSSDKKQIFPFHKSEE